MFNKTKEPAEIVYSESALIAISASIDELDRYEASDDAVGSCLVTVLSKMGYSQEDALAGSLEGTRHIKGMFQQLYWKENTYSNKVMVFYSVLEATKALIDGKMINEITKQKVREVLAEQGDNTSSK